ncbi:hypothetical protein M9H77_35873 [Catharanthus roseus]|uniref:Uncharacterized protein n=1 Tax=Catharanthus roseus TaxID=4058 RepID=A0ACB9ZS46_CATRO|nr:hypothetical protein M9H77_35873 [Catharanthus roseus]
MVDKEVFPRLWVPLRKENCHGAASKKVFRHVSDLINMHRPDVLCLLETKVSSNKAQRVMRVGNFDSFVAAEARDFAGIWCFWKATTALKVLSVNDQHASLSVMRGNRASWMLTVIYSSPVAKYREELWNELRQVGLRNQVPWLLVGDYNQIIHEKEKLGDNDRWRRAASSLWDFIDECGLVDLVFWGARLTCTNSRLGEENIMERLDRTFCNQAWNISYMVLHLSHTCLELTQTIVQYLLTQRGSARCKAVTCPFVLAKLTWRMIQNPEVLWTKILWKKYGNPMSNRCGYLLDSAVAGSSNAEFIVKICYKALHAPSQTDHTCRGWRNMWKIKGPTRLN